MNPLLLRHGTGDQKPQSRAFGETGSDGGAGQRKTQRLRRERKGQNGSASGNGQSLEERRRFVVISVPKLDGDDSFRSLLAMNECGDGDTIARRIHRVLPLFHAFRLSKLKAYRNSYAAAFSLFDFIIITVSDAEL